MPLEPSETAPGAGRKRAGLLNEERPFSLIANKASAEDDDDEPVLRLPDDD